MSSELDFDGCGRACRKQQQHTREWGSCEHGVEPPPTLTRHRLADEPDEDGYRSLVGETLTAVQVAEWLREQGYTVAGSEVETHWEWATIHDLVDGRTLVQEAGEDEELAHIRLEAWREPDLAHHRTRLVRRPMMVIRGVYEDVKDGES